MINYLKIMNGYKVQSAKHHTEVPCYGGTASDDHAATVTQDQYIYFAPMGWL